MKYHPDRHHRQSIRLPQYDYRQAGAYFVTICSNQRQCLFGEIIGGELRLNDVGEIVQTEWLRSAMVRPYIELDVFVVMPNHLHGIIMLRDTPARTRATQRVAPTTGDTGAPSTDAHGPARDSIGAIIGQFKSITTKRINEIRNTQGSPLWQRNYYEAVLRDEHQLARVRQYILDNPGKWSEDTENPQNRYGRPGG